MSSNFIVTAPNVAELHDSDIDVLLDLHVFKQDAWCHHPCILTPDHNMIGCVHCGYFEVLKGQPYSLSAPHVRNVPHYTKGIGDIWPVVETMKRYDAQVKMRFELRLNALYHCRIFNLSPRLIAEAALQALEVVDQAGYLRVVHHNTAS